MLTYGDLKNHVLLAIGGRPSTASGQTVAERQAEIINTAGEHLFTHPWKFREATATVTTVVSQSYVALPSDFAELTQVWKDDYPLWIQSPEEVETARQTNYPDLTWRAYVKTVLPTTIAPTQSFRLELYPTPTTAEPLKVLYRIGWQSVTSSTATSEVISIPKHVEATLISYVRAVAEAYEDGQQSQRFAEIEAGPIFGAAKQKDGMVQSHFGQVQPNLWRSGTRNGPGFIILNPVQNPS
jgi:hypothetical protein